MPFTYMWLRTNQVAARLREGSLLRYPTGTLTSSMVKSTRSRQTGGRYIPRLRKGLRQSSTWCTAAETVEFWYFWCTFELVPRLPHQKRTEGRDRRSEFFLVLYPVSSTSGLITWPLVLCNLLSMTCQKLLPQGTQCHYMLTTAKHVGW